MYWESDAVSDDEFRARLAAASRQSPLPELNLRADKATRYERIAFVLSAAQQAGLAKIGFVTEPAATVRP